jgi:hypothetical protein
MQPRLPYQRRNHGGAGQPGTVEKISQAGNGDDNHKSGTVSQLSINVKLYGIVPLYKFLVSHIIQDLAQRAESAKSPPHNDCIG